jgi:hypothetical protein
MHTLYIYAYIHSQQHILGELCIIIATYMHTYMHACIVLFHANHLRHHTSHHLIQYLLTVYQASLFSKCVVTLHVHTPARWRPRMNDEMRQ